MRVAVPSMSPTNTCLILHGLDSRRSGTAVALCSDRIVIDCSQMLGNRPFLKDGIGQRPRQARHQYVAGKLLHSAIFPTILSRQGSLRNLSSREDVGAVAAQYLRGSSLEQLRHQGRRGRYRSRKGSVQRHCGT